LSQTEIITKRLKGKIAVITGGSSGIGLATAQRFVDEGAFVFITGRRQSEVNNAIKEIGKNVTGIQGDVSNLEDLDHLYDTVNQEKGRIDILFANAGVMDSASLGSITEDHFDKIFNVNVKGLLFTVQKALPLFQEGGSIILTWIYTYTVLYNVTLKDDLNYNVTKSNPYYNPDDNPNDENMHRKLSLYDGWLYASTR
jgi:short-subunit dehydrogenase involved in D-alanine esterification of teichoic acids